MSKNKLVEFYDSLPKEIRVLPYIALAGALTAIVDHLRLVQLDDRVVMGIINIALVFLVQAKPRVERLKSK